MAKKNKQEAPVEQEIVKAIEFTFKDTDMVEIIGKGLHGLREGKEFKVGGKLAKVLINKGAAILKS